MIPLKRIHIFYFILNTWFWWCWSQTYIWEKKNAALLPKKNQAKPKKKEKTMKMCYICWKHSFESNCNNCVGSLAFSICRQILPDFLVWAIELWGISFKSQQRANNWIAILIENNCQFYGILVILREYLNLFMKCHSYSRIIQLTFTTIQIFTIWFTHILGLWIYVNLNR